MLWIAAVQTEVQTFGCVEHNAYAGLLAQLLLGVTLVSAGLGSCDTLVLVATKSWDAVVPIRLSGVGSTTRLFVLAGSQSVGDADPIVGSIGGWTAGMVVRASRVIDLAVLHAKVESGSWIKLKAGQACCAVVVRLVIDVVGPTNVAQVLGVGAGFQASTSSAGQRLTSKACGAIGALRVAKLSAPGSIREGHANGGGHTVVVVGCNAVTVAL